MAIKIKRIYEPYVKADGYRILVDRLWPRGIKKEDAHVDLWMKEIAPSTELRKWFNHEPEKWEQFITKYEVELKTGTSFKELTTLVAVHKTVTLLYAAKDEVHNQAMVLYKLLSE